MKKKESKETHGAHACPFRATHLAVASHSWKPPRGELICSERERKTQRRKMIESGHVHTCQRLVSRLTAAKMAAFCLQISLSSSVRSERGE